VKLLLVLGTEETHNMISFYVRPLGFEVIHYSHVIKAMDNLDEIDPQAIIISARDFPRHWKIMVQFARHERSKDVCPIIILRGKDFSQDESHKASFLGVSGIVNEELENTAEIDRLQGILSRYLPVAEKRRNRRYHTGHGEHLGFVFVSPAENSLVTGEVKTISAGGLSFLPDNPSLMKNIGLNTELEECSLRAGDSILSPVCRLVRTGRSVSIQFTSFPENEPEILNKYLETLPLIENVNTGRP